MDNYLILRESSPSNLESSVQEFLRRGWKISGSMAVFDGDLLQAIHLPEPKEIEYQRGYTDDDSFFLSREDVVKLTGWKKKQKQIEWLKHSEIDFQIDRDGHPIIAKLSLINDISLPFGFDRPHPNLKRTEVRPNFNAINLANDDFCVEFLPDNSPFKNFSPSVRRIVEGLGYTTKSELKEDFLSGELALKIGVGEKTLEAVKDLVE